MRRSIRKFNIPPRATPGHLNFWRLACSNSLPSGQKSRSNAPPINTELPLLKDKFRLQSNILHAFQREIGRNDTFKHLTHADAFWLSDLTKGRHTSDFLKTNCTYLVWGTIGILTEPWRPILRCYYDFVQWIILLGREVCAIGFEKIACMSSFCQVAKSEWEPELYLWVNSSEFRTCRAVIVAKSGQMTPSLSMYYTCTNTQ